MSVLAEHGMELSAHGFSSLKFFTVLSNLFNGGVCLAYAFRLWKEKTFGSKQKTVKLLATAAVGLTFLTVMGFLGPLYGYAKMFKGANLWFHLLLPLLSFFSFMVLEQEKKIPFRNTFYAVIPTALYEIGYVSNLLINGIGTWPDTNDIYGFMNWGIGPAAVIAVVILLVTWLIAAALYAGNRIFGKIVTNNA